ncbi:YidX family protein [Psychrobacter jeotgali]|uniref:hypothetical protein n=1 Tax=Psychrobacter jeotgali TaxID=179010 RepID=UPI0019184597|nr:hypothetical protein [Psychrobacter jeotgali]
MNQSNQLRASSTKSSYIAKSVMSSAVIAALLVSSGCATSSLLENENRVSSKTVTNVLSEDQIVAFGRPAQPIPNLPTGNMVIVGEKNSYVLVQGGAEMVTLLTNLTAKNIQVENDMSFEVPNNDGYFQGQMKMSYAKLKDEFQRSDYQFFLQNGGQECTSASDMRMNAQRFCFSVPVKGAIYPQVSNLSLIQSKYRALSKPYTVTFYNRTAQNEVTRSGRNGAEKLILLPFAVAFDVVTFPVQLLDSIAN